MSIDFIEKGYNLDSINKAAIQEEQLSYFSMSKLQDNTLNQEYYKQWAIRKYQTDDYFLNMIKSIFKTENFLLAFKYLRYPLPSARLVKNKIEPQLRRVFYAEDSGFKYDITGKTNEDFIESLNIKDFNDNIFQRLLYNHNSILISDLDNEKINSPHRYFIDVKNVVSILENENKIWKIAYRGSIIFEGEFIDGYIYIDDKEYIFYDKDKKMITSASHDLGYCPAHFIAKEKYKNNFFIRQSIFTFIREELEEYTFLKTLQRMVEANGVIPVVSKLEVKYEDEPINKGSGEPDSDTIMGSQKAGDFSTNDNLGTGDFEPGTIHEISQESIRDQEGKINMDVVKSFINFHYTPVEPIKYLDERIKGLERSIVTTIVGDVVSSSEESKNQLQIEKSISVLENTLSSFAEVLNRIRTLSDTDMLSLMYSPALVNEVFIHYGTDFFLDSQTKLFEDLGKAPNALERKNIIVRINQNRYKNNIDQLSRQVILYELMPYVSDKDFDKAVSSQLISDVNMEYQLRFNYWISQFEANFGDIVMYYTEMDLNNSQKLIVINNLIKELIILELPTKEKEDENIKDQDEKDLQS